MINAKLLKAKAKDICVLYVEDEPSVREQVTTILSMIFNNLDVAKDGKEGLERLNSRDYDLLISDITMPNLDGFEMIEAMTRNKNIKKILATAQADEDNFSKAIQMNIDGYIVKPVQMEQLFNTLEKVLNSIELEKNQLNFEYELQKKLDEQALVIKSQSVELLNSLTIDSLTNLPNLERLKIDYAEHLSSKMVVVLLNIDNFNYINLTYGFNFGDDVLLIFSQKLKSISPFKDIYKLHGDEFIILIKDEDLDDVMQRIVEFQYNLNSMDYFIGGSYFNITVSIGLVEATQEDKEVPYFKARLAMQEGRIVHKATIMTYHDSMELLQKQKSLLEWSKKSKEALYKDRIVPYFQPIMNLDTGQIEKYECLARMIDEDENIIAPFYFIDSLQKSGNLSKLTRVMIRKSFKYFSLHRCVSFSINISDEDLKEGYLIDFLVEEANIHDIQHSRVILEVLENISNYDTSDANKQLLELKNLGFKVALDDFGAQNSNFSRIQNLNIDIIKIDGEFIKNILEDENSLHIVQTIVYYAKKAKIKVVAEFVHNQQIYELLKEIGVDYTQGYYIGKPSSEILS